MPFKFKLGRKKSSSPPSIDGNHLESGAGSSFRVIPRGGPPQKCGMAVIDKPLPSLNNHTRQWSEDDTSSSNRASDSTSSTNKSQGYRPHAYGHTTLPYGETTQRNDGLQNTSYISPGESDRASYLDMPLTSQSEEGFGQIFRDSDAGQNTAPSSYSHHYETPARPSRYSKTPPLHSSRSADLNPSPLSFQSSSSDDESLSPSFVAVQQERGPPPPAHVSPPVKIQTYNVMRDVVSPSFSEEYRAESWDASVIKRMNSTESFTRSGNGIDADAKMVRSSVLIRRDTTDSQNLDATSPLRPIITKRFSSLHPPAQHQSQVTSSDSSKSPSISSTTSSQGQTLSDVSTTPKGASPSTPQPQNLSNSSTPRAAPVKTAVVDSDSDDEPLANTLQRISSNPRLSIIPAQIAGFRLSVVPPENKLLTKFDTLRPVSTASGALDASLDRARLSSEQVPDPTSHRPLSAQDLAGDTPSNDRVSTASEKFAPVDVLQHAHSNTDNDNKLSDDDDDVPLALLPATSSPLRGRVTESRLGQHSFAGQGRPGVGYPTPSIAGGRSSLPPFARRLPHDPYGSPEGVLNASRESLLLNRPPIMFPPGQSPVPGMPPGGLVGVIAEEERNKSWRRAAGAGQIGPAGLNAGMSMGMQGPMSIPGLGHGLLGQQQMAPGMIGAEQTQFNQQLVQLVHQQSMMLQQMQAMMQQQQQQYAGSVIGYAEPEYGQQLPGSPSLRPRSMLNSSLRTRSMVNLNRPPNAPRTMSMISTGANYPTNWSMGQEPLISSATSVRGMANGYEPSVAPSERSMIGQPNRYRPVTNPQAAADSQSNSGAYNRTSMANPPVYGPLAGDDDHDDPMAKKKRSGFFSAIIHPRGRNSTVQAEEDEDWGTFAQNRRSTFSTTLG